MVLLLYTAAVVPLQVGFRAMRQHAVTFVDNIVLGVFWLDIAVQFRFGERPGEPLWGLLTGRGMPCIHGAQMSGDLDNLCLLIFAAYVVHIYGT